MGLGKTAASLSALTPDHLPALVVAPKRVAENVWDAERDIWRPDLSIAVAKGSPAVRQTALKSTADIVVLGRDNLGDLAKVDRADRPFRTFIIDELSGYKSQKSVRWKTLRRAIAAHAAPYVWGLTGTPVPNGYLDLWAQIALLDGGERLGRNITTYRNRYFFAAKQLPNGVVTDWALREEAEDRIKEKISDICLAMATEGRIKLPEVTFNDVVVRLPADARKVYRTLIDDLVVDLREIFGGEVHTAGTAATLTTRLSQIACGFIYEDAAYEDTGELDQDGEPILTHVNAGHYTTLHHTKVEAVREIVTSPHTGGVLVAYRYAWEREALAEHLADLGVRRIEEDGVIAAWNRGKVPVLLAHPASAGHGLNLQHGGHTIVWTQPTWDLEHWDQFNKRLARQGQKHPVVIHVIMAAKTVDGLVRRRLADKADVQNDLLAYLESPV